MARFTASNPRFEEEARAIFSNQSVMRTLRAKMVSVLPGEVEIEMPYQDSMAQQDKFLHAGVTTTLVDTACGCAAFTLMPPGSRVLTAEYKVNLLAPAAGQRFVAKGWVVRPGRLLTVCQGEVVAYADDRPKTVAIMQATMVRLSGDA